MKRSGFKHGSGGELRRTAPLKRTSRLKPRSKKTEALYAGDAAAGLEGRREFVARILQERPWCEACALIGLYRWGHAGPRHRSTEVHEVLRRSAGGSIVDDANVNAVCAEGHRWIHEHPREARELGLLASRYAGRNAPAETP